MVSFFSAKKYISSVTVRSKVHSKSVGENLSVSLFKDRKENLFLDKVSYRSGHL